MLDAHPLSMSFVHAHQKCECKHSSQRQTKSLVFLMYCYTQQIDFIESKCTKQISQIVQTQFIPRTNRNANKTKRMNERVRYLSVRFLLNLFPTIWLYRCTECDQYPFSLVFLIV